MAVGSGMQTVYLQLVHSTRPSIKLVVFLDLLGKRPDATGFDGNPARMQAGPAAASIPRPGWSGRRKTGLGETSDDSGRREDGRQSTEDRLNLRCKRAACFTNE